MNVNYQLPSLKNYIVFSSLVILMAAIFFNYFDKAIAEYTFYNTGETNYSFIFRYFTYLQPFYYTVTPWFVFYLFGRLYLKKPIYNWHKVTIIMIFSMSITLLINEQLRIIFGRYWPATWFHGNLSWITHKAYGFTWFQKAHEFKSFPSSHTALTFGLMMPLWWIQNNLKARVFVILNCLLVPLGLILKCYHFTSDIIVGALVGATVSYIVLSGIKIYKDNYIK